MFEFTARPGTLIARVHVPVEACTPLLSLRRLAADYATTPFAVLSGAPRELALPTDRAPQSPWSIRISTTGPINVCAG